MILQMHPSPLAKAGLKSASESPDRLSPSELVRPRLQVSKERIIATIPSFLSLWILQGSRHPTIRAVGFWAFAFGPLQNRYMALHPCLSLLQITQNMMIGRDASLMPLRVE